MAKWSNVSFLRWEQRITKCNVNALIRHDAHRLYVSSDCGSSRWWSCQDIPGVWEGGVSHQRSVGPRATTFCWHMKMFSILFHLASNQSDVTASLSSNYCVTALIIAGESVSPSKWVGPDQKQGETRLPAVLHHTRPSNPAGSLRYQQLLRLHQSSPKAGQTLKEWWVSFLYDLFLMMMRHFNPNARQRVQGLEGFRMVLVGHGLWVTWF